MRTIAVVAGGNSSEREVSHKSAATIYKFLDRNLYNPYIVDIHGKDWKAIIGEKSYPVDRNDFSFTLDGKKICFDYAYIIIHGKPGENGVFEGYLDMMEIPYSTCDVLASALTFDKYKLNQYLRSFKINVAKSMLLKAGIQRPDDDKIVEHLGLPCFVKPTAGGSSFGTTKVSTKEQFAAAIDAAFQENDEIVIESFLDGTEVTNGYYKTKKGEVRLPVTEVVPKTEFFDYDAKYNGMVSEITPARIPDSMRDLIQQTTAMIYDAVGCKGIVRNDYIIGRDGSLNLLEVNTTPGMTPTSFIPQQIKAAGLDLTDVLTDIIEDSF